MYEFVHVHMAKLRHQFCARDHNNNNGNRLADSYSPTSTKLEFSETATNLYENGLYVLSLARFLDQLRSLIFHDITISGYFEV